MRDLGILLDSELTMVDHITQLCQSCFFQLRRIRTIRRSLSTRSMLTLTHSFICNRIDFCNSILHGVSLVQLDRLQSILNASARVVLNIRKFDHISAAIRDQLHWLPVRLRPVYKLCMLTRNCVLGVAPVYLQELCPLVSATAGRQQLRSACRSDLVIPRCRTVRYGQRGFSVCGPCLWNSLPMDIRSSINTLELFKKKLKTYLFTK